MRAGGRMWGRWNVRGMGGGGGHLGQEGPCSGPV